MPVDALVERLNECRSEGIKSTLESIFDVLAPGFRFGVVLRDVNVLGDMYGEHPDRSLFHTNLTPALSSILASALLDSDGHTGIVFPHSKPNVVYLNSPEACLNARPSVPPGVVALLRRAVKESFGVFVAIPARAALSQGALLLFGGKLDGEARAPAGLPALYYAAQRIAAILEHRENQVARDLMNVPECTDRQLQTLRAALCGRTDEEIGVLLQISPNTVRYHLKEVRARYRRFPKLGPRDIARLLRQLGRLF